MTTAIAGRSLLTKDLPPEVERAVRDFFADYTGAIDPLREDLVEAAQDGAFDPGTVSSIDVEVAQRTGNYTTDLQEVYRVNTQNGAAAGRAVAARRHALDVSFDVVPENVLREFETWSEEIVKSEVMETITDETTQYIKAAQETGLSNQDLARQINDELFDGRLQGYQARANARTSTISSSNAGSHSAYKESRDAGVVAEEWLATVGDGRTRPTHRAANGQTVGVGNSFSVGGHTARYPADPSLPAEEIVNCRCTVIPRFADSFTSSELGTLQSGGTIWQ